jgi:hypothetical protein
MKLRNGSKLSKKKTNYIKALWYGFLLVYGVECYKDEEIPKLEYTSI